MAKTVSDLTHTGQVNSFTGGLNTDLHPLVQPNDTLTDCVNGTLITYNGNENMLQNDMGNYALEGSELPDGFIPLGLKEHNGIVYIVSHNPNTKEVQIGSYPSPEIKVTEDGTTLDSDPILMTTTDSVDYSFDKCYDMRCVESGKESETQYTEFDVELNFGDLYSISPMEGNIDFQYEQFAIKEENGKITNIDPITDGKMHTVNWTSCGKLCKKYKLNKVLDFTQDVTWLVNTDVEKSRIVGALPNTSASYEFLKEDFQSITIKNTVKFDRIDITREDNDELLVGVVHKVITGNPQKYILQKLSWAKCTKTHDRIVTAKFDGSLEYDFTHTISKDDPSAAGFMYFLRQWQGTNYVGGQYGGPVKIQSYPILIHRVNGKDKSVLLYDESGKQTSISELDVKGDFVYQYYCDQISDGSTKIYLTLNDLDTSKSFSTFLLTLDDKGNLRNNNSELLTFEYKSDHWEGTTSSTESVLFLQYGYYVLPLFTSVTKDKYDLFLDKYDNFCLIPGDKFLNFTTQDNIQIESTNTTKYIKLTEGYLKRHDTFFYNSVYAKDNEDTYYGDVEYGNITIANYSGNKATLELQKQNKDGSWTTLETKLAQVTNGMATFKDCIISANIQKAVGGDTVNKCFERVYLAKIGHALFAHNETGNTDETAWKTRFIENTGFENKSAEKLFDALYKYGEWTSDKKKSLRVGKHCGKYNNEFVVDTCDIYGNIDTEVPRRTYATSEEWKSEFKNASLFVPVTFNVNCDRAGISTWLLHRDVDKHDVITYESFRCPVSTTSFTTVLAKTDDLPVLLTDSTLAWSSVDKSLAKAPNYTLFDRWLLYLYTHAFYYTESATSMDKFTLIKNNGSLEKLRFIIKGVFTKSIVINGQTVNNKNKEQLLSQLNIRCNNFDSIDNVEKNPTKMIESSNSNKLWMYLNGIANSIKQDDSINIDYSALYCDVYQDSWSVVKWGDDVNDVNYNYLVKLISDFNIKDCQLKNIGSFPIIETFGQKSIGVPLANIPISNWTYIIMDDIKFGKLKHILKDVLSNPIKREMTGSTIGLNNKSAGVYELDHESLASSPIKYDFSPRFKQIINYGTDD